MIPTGVREAGEAREHAEACRADTSLSSAGVLQVRTMPLSSHIGTY